MNNIILNGCRPTPLASYLKALGILRLVTQQADPEAHGWWCNEQFILQTNLTRDELIDFFLDTYQPSPIVAPWNGGSGFYPKDNQEAIKSIESGDASRFGPLRETIQFARVLLRKQGITEKPDAKNKSDLIANIRSSCPDLLVHWIDCALAVTTDKAEFPPLLGTGGNDGRLDFTKNYLQRLVEVFSPDSGQSNDMAINLLPAALFDEPVSGMTAVAIGQFAPGNAGGVNSTNSYEGDSAVNPWDFILMLEGALVIAGGVIRRFASETRSRAAFPFTVRATGAGYGSSSYEEESDSRGEFWAPLWSQPTGLNELTTLFREGRIAQTRYTTKDGVDAMLAISSVAADRRISSFQRYGFVKRQGLAFLATPIGRHQVEQRQTNLIANLDRDFWLERVRRKARDKNAPARFRSAVKLLEDALFEYAKGSNIAVAISEIIIAFGRIVRIIAPSKELRDAISFIPLLMHPEWVTCGDSSSEFRLATALSGLYWRHPSGLKNQNVEHKDNNKDNYLFRRHLVPIADSSWFDKKLSWSKSGTSNDTVWTEGNLIDSMVSVALRRSMEATRQTETAGGNLFAGRYASLNNIAAFINGSVDDERINNLVCGLAWVRPTKGIVYNVTDAQRGEQPPVPFAYSALKPIFAPQPDDSKTDESDHEERRKSMKFPPTIAPLLASENLSDAVKVAMQRARADGLPTPFEGIKSTGVDSRRLLAALLFPVSEQALCQCQERAYPSDDNERST